jgi:Transposase DDE domain
VAYVRTVKTASGATAVQIVHSSRRGSRDIEHIGSAHDDAQLELLKAAAKQRLAAGQEELDLGLDAGADRGGPLPITSSRMGHLWDALSRAYEVLGFDAATDADEVFRALVLARIIEPTSKLDSLRVLEEAGIDPPSYPTMNRRLPVFATDQWRQALAAACAAHAVLGPASLVLYDVSTLYFETDTADGFREPGFSKERRLDPQITIGLLTDAAGFPLMVTAFEGNKAETATMLPTITAFMEAHQLGDVTIVADAGMISDANKRAIEAAGLSFILGMRIPDVPYVFQQWRQDHADEEIPDGHIFTQPWPAGPTDRQATGPAHLLPIPARPGPPHPARHRSAGRQGRESRRRHRAGEAKQVHHAVRRHEEGQPHPGGQGPSPGRAQGIHHQPRGRDRGIRDRCLPPVFPD